MGIRGRIRQLMGRGAQPATCHPWVEDPVAAKTGWAALHGRATNMCTQRLKRISADRYEFKATFAAYASSGVYLVFGVALGGGMGLVGLKEGTTGLVYAGVTLGVLLLILGVYYLRLMTKPCVFDKGTGCFWKGRRAAGRRDLGTIHALQIVGHTYEFSLSDDNPGIGYVPSTFRSYELNLVLENCDRINAVEHGKIKILRRDAQSLAEFLEVPFWDATRIRRR